MNNHENSRFNFHAPFATVDGRPARLLGVVDAAFPYAVAIRTSSDLNRPTREIVLYYNEDATMYSMLSMVGVAYLTAQASCGLVPISDEQYFAMRQSDLVVAAVLPMNSYPPNSNPCHHDLGSLCTPLVRGWTVMSEGYSDSSTRPLRGFYLNNTLSGQNIRVVLTKKP
jgi:hypothetical protein